MSKSKKYCVIISDCIAIETNSKLRAVFEMVKLYFTSEWFDVMRLVKDGKYSLIEVDGIMKN